MPNNNDFASNSGDSTFDSSANNDLNNQTVTLDIETGNTVDDMSDTNFNTSDSSTTPDTTQGGDPNSVDYWKNRYGSSTKEAQRLAKEYKEAQPFVEVGKAFTDRYNSDSEWQEYINSFDTWKASRAGQSTQTPNANRIEPQKTDTQPVTPVATVLTPEQQKAIDYANQSMERESARRGQVWDSLEGDDAGELDKYNQVAIDPKTKMPVIQNGRPVEYNPERWRIGQDAAALEAKGVPFEEAAKRAIYSWKVRMNPEKYADRDEARRQGLLDGLESQSITTFSQRGSGQRTKQVHIDAETQKIMRAAGLTSKEDMDTFTKLWNE